VSGLVASAQTGLNRFSAVLTGDGEVPAVSTDASGTLTIDIDEADERIEWELTYSGLQDDTTTGDDVTQAHIHFGQPFVAGGIVLWFCKTTQTTAPAGTQTCPQTETAHLSGVFTPASVTVPGTQQIAAGDFDAVVAAIRKGFAYGNVHTVTTGSGEIRGQLKLKPGNGQN
jgi:hypothetical protein